MIHTVSMHADYWPKGAIILLILRLVLVEASTERAKRRGTSTVFRGSPHRAEYAIRRARRFFAWTMLTDWKGENFWVLAGGCLFVCLFLVAWPSTISLSDAGVKKSWWWGRRIVIPWEEVTAIERSAGGDLAVFGASGRRVTLSRYHAAPAVFEFEVKRRAHLKETMDASAPLTLGLQDYPRERAGIQVVTR